MNPKSSKITRAINEEKGVEEFTLAMRIANIEDEAEADEVRRTLKKALVKYGGQGFIDETEKSP